MSQYLLSTYRVAGEVPGAPQDPEEMNAFMQRVIAVENELENAGAFVFGGALSNPEDAAVAKVGDTLVTDGPFAESKEHIAGFYVINANTDEDAHDWARRVADATNHPIEVRRFSATGLVKEMSG